MPKKLKKSSALRSIPRSVTSDSGNVTTHSDKTPEIGHDPAESAVTFRRNQRSRSIGITGHDASEYAPAWTPEKTALNTVEKRRPKL
jgi:hypothetical protein